MAKKTKETKKPNTTNDTGQGSDVRPIILEPELPECRTSIVRDPIDYSNPMNYRQIGCDLYIATVKPDAFGHINETLLSWSWSQFKKDTGTEYEHKRALVPRFLGTVCIPCNTDKYQDNVYGYLNTYARPLWMPSPGPFPHIQKMCIHIFGEQYEYGVDYLQILYLQPKQKLPILLLVSEERETGKTTFLNLLKEMFGANMTFVTNESMRSNFNNERAGKLIIACDETLLNKKEDSERLKALSTSLKSYIEPKGKDRFEVDNFGKFIMASNDIMSPVYIDMEEKRYWVREVQHLESNDPGFLDSMKIEIPAFLDFLSHRALHVPVAKSRMWFDMSELSTPALIRIKQACRPSNELELADMLLDLMDTYHVDTLEYTTSDLTSIIKTQMMDIKDAHRIICKTWRVPHAPNKLTYDLYAPYEKSPVRKTGRYYTFTRKFLEGLLPQAPEHTTPASPEYTHSSIFNEEMRNNS